MAAVASGQRTDQRLADLSLLLLLFLSFLLLVASSRLTENSETQRQRGTIWAVMGGSQRQRGTIWAVMGGFSRQPH